MSKKLDLLYAFGLGFVCCCLVDEVANPETSMMKKAYGVDIRNVFSNNTNTMKKDSVNANSINKIIAPANK